MNKVIAVILCIETKPYEAVGDVANLNNLSRDRE